jgi:hypothetical protein
MRVLTLAYSLQTLSITIRKLSFLQEHRTVENVAHHKDTSPETANVVKCATFTILNPAYLTVDPGQMSGTNRHQIQHE